MPDREKIVYNRERCFRLQVMIAHTKEYPRYYTPLHYFLIPADSFIPVNNDFHAR